MNRLILLGLCLLSASAWAQQSNGTCIQQWQMGPWTQIDAQTAMVEAGRKQYVVTVPDCESFFTGRNNEVVGSTGSRVCEGAAILYYEGSQVIETCIITDIVRIRLNAQTNTVEVNEFDE